MTSAVINAKRKIAVKESQWTAERIETLRSLLAEGASAREVACELGTTRRAVIGKARRLGVAMAGNTPAVRQQGERPKDFDARVQAYIPFFRKFAGRTGIAPQDREDFVNEVISTSLARWQNYNDSNGFFGWLYFQARSVRQKMAAQASANNHGALNDDIASAAGGQESDAAANQLISRLSAHRFGDRAMMVAAGFSLPEIAKKLGVSKQRVEQQIRIVARDLRASGYASVADGTVAA